MAKIINVTMQPDGRAKVSYESGSVKTFAELPRTAREWLKAQEGTKQEEPQTEQEPQTAKAGPQMEKAPQADQIRREEPKAPKMEQEPQREKEPVKAESPREPRQAAPRIDPGPISAKPFEAPAPVPDQKPVEGKPLEKRAAIVYSILADMWAIICIVGYDLLFAWWAVEDATKAARKMAPKILHKARRAGQAAGHTLAPVAIHAAGWAAVLALLAIKAAAKLADMTAKAAVEVRAGWAMRAEILAEEAA